MGEVTVLVSNLSLWQPAPLSLGRRPRPPSATHQAAGGGRRLLLRAAASVWRSWHGAVHGAARSIPHAQSALLANGVVGWSCANECPAGKRTAAATECLAGAGGCPASRAGGGAWPQGSDAGSVPVPPGCRTAASAESDLQPQPYGRERCIVPVGLRERAAALDVAASAEPSTMQLPVFRSRAQLQAHAIWSHYCETIYGELPPDEDTGDGRSANALPRPPARELPRGRAQRTGVVAKGRFRLLPDAPRPGVPEDVGDRRGANSLHLAAAEPH